MTTIDELKKNLSHLEIEETQVYEAAEHTAKAETGWMFSKKYQYRLAVLDRKIAAYLTVLADLEVRARAAGDLPIANA